MTSPPPFVVPPGETLIALGAAGDRDGTVYDLTLPVPFTIMGITATQFRVNNSGFMWPSNLGGASTYALLSMANFDSILDAPIRVYCTPSTVRIVVEAHAYYDGSTVRQTFYADVNPSGSWTGVLWRESGTFRGAAPIGFKTGIPAGTTYRFSAPVDAQFSFAAERWFSSSGARVTFMCNALADYTLVSAASTPQRPQFVSSLPRTVTHLGCLKSAALPAVVSVVDTASSATLATATVTDTSYGIDHHYYAALPEPVIIPAGTLAIHGSAASLGVVPASASGVAALCTPGFAPVAASGSIYYGGNLILGSTQPPVFPVQSATITLQTSALSRRDTTRALATITVTDPQSYPLSYTISNTAQLAAADIALRFEGSAVHLSSGILSDATYPVVILASNTIEATTGTLTLSVLVPPTAESQSFAPVLSILEAQQPGQPVARVASSGINLVTYQYVSGAAPAAAAWPYNLSAETGEISVLGGTSAVINSGSLSSATLVVRDGITGRTTAPFTVSVTPTLVPVAEIVNLNGTTGSDLVMQVRRVSNGRLVRATLQPTRTGAEYVIGDGSALEDSNGHGSCVFEGRVSASRTTFDAEGGHLALNQGSSVAASAVRFHNTPNVFLRGSTSGDIKIHNQSALRKFNTGCQAKGRALMKAG